MTGALIAAFLVATGLAVSQSPVRPHVSRGDPAGGGFVAAGIPAAAPPAPAIPGGRGRLVVHVRHATFMGPRPAVPSIARVLTRTEMGSPRVLPVLRRRGEWLGVLAEERPNGRIGWIHLDTNLSLSRVPISVRVSLRRRMLVVRRLGRRLLSVRVAVGAPGTPTPTGRFAVTDRLRNRGPSAYGCCVLALSGHQPYLEPGWTGGNRIAIHSTLQPSSIGQAVSHGCIRAGEQAMRTLLSLVPVGAIVTIRD